MKLPAREKTDRDTFGRSCAYREPWPGIGTQGRPPFEWAGAEIGSYKTKARLSAFSDISGSPDMTAIVLSLAWSYVAVRAIMEAQS